MAHTAPLAKATSQQAKNISQKVVKLTKPGAGKARLQTNLSPGRTKKNERSTKSSNKVVALGPKGKTAVADDKKNGKVQQAKTAPKRAAMKSVLTKAPGRKAASGPTATMKDMSNSKALPAPVVLRTLGGQGKSKSSEMALVQQPENRATDRSFVRGIEAEKVSPENIKIFQIYYQPEQQEYLDPDFTPYDNSGNSSRLFEFSVFTKLAQSNDIKNAKYWGAMSWKFGRKVGVSGRHFKEEIIANPGYDAYYCNPFPENEALFHNMWLQGEIAHPNFMPLCAEIFEVAGLPTGMLTAMQPSSEFSAANYFVANQAFWRAYIGFISRVLISADKKLSPTAKRIFYSSTADKFGAHAEASYIPFLVERLFPVFLRTEGARFKTFKLTLPGRERKDNVHLKLLVEMKDIACRTKSLWMAACWINYRNLYLSKIYGENWTKSHLKQITPTSIVFMPETIKLHS